MKKYTVLLLLFLLPFYLFSQSGDFKIPVINEKSLKSDLLIKDSLLLKKNLFNLDIGLLCLEFSYARNFKKNSKWYIGCGTGFYCDGLLQAKNIYNAYNITNNFFSENRYCNIYEFLNASIHTNYLISENFSLKSGITLNEIFVKDSEIGGMAFMGIFVSPLVGIKNYKLGTRFLIGVVDPTTSGFHYILTYYNPLFFISINL